MDYGKAKDITIDRLIRQSDRSLKATSVRWILASEIAYPRKHGPNDEREAAVHVRKMIAEGEIEERTMDKRLYYKLPTQENQA
jgi:hypothetical protein